MTKSGVECTIPVLPVKNLAKSIEFYTDVLGFTVEWGGAEGSVCSVSREGHSIMLRADEDPHTTWVWIGLQDETLLQLYRKRRVRVLQEPRNMSWAYEMKLADPDGNVLWFGTEPRRNEPTVN